MLHRLLHGHRAVRRRCCYDGMGWLTWCERCDPDWVGRHPRAAHGLWR